MPISPSSDDLDRAIEILRNGGLVAIPTETVYGLAANARDEMAVRRIFNAKARPLTSPLIVHVGSIEAARSLTAGWPALAETLARRFWPGPLTIILPKAPDVLDAVTAGLPSVALRIPAHPVALELLRQSGLALAAPSANRFMQLSPTTAEHVAVGLGSAVDLILDGGPCAVGIESTVVSVAGAEPCILRPGMITAADLEEATGLTWPTHSPQVGEQTGEANIAHSSPGLHARHYAPNTAFYVLSPGTPHPPGRGEILAMPSDPASFAESLYGRLHLADQAHDDWIGILEPPDTPEWAGIRDRLKRASTQA